MILKVLMISILTATNGFCLKLMLNFNFKYQNDFPIRMNFEKYYGKLK